MRRYCRSHLPVLFCVSTECGASPYLTAAKSEGITIMKTGFAIIVILAMHGAASATADLHWTFMNGPGCGSIEPLVSSGTHVFAGGHGGIFRSDDSGKHWYNILTTNYGDDVTSLLVVDSTILFVSQKQSIGRSTDFGKTWTPSQTSVKYVSSLCSAGGYCFLVRSDGVLRSTNVGATWDLLPGSLVGQNTHSMYAFDNVLYLTDTCIFRSTDFGNTWISNVAPSSLDFYIGIASVRGMLFAATMESGVFRSRNHGGTWEPFNNGLTCPYTQCIVADSSCVLVFTQDGVFRLDSASAAWTLLPPNPLFASTSPATLATLGSSDLIGTPAGVYMSADHGTHWTPSNSGLNNACVNDIAVNDRGVYAATTNGIYRTTDQGTSWTTLLEAGASHIIVEGRQLTAGRSNVGGSFFVLTSDDDGSTWRTLRMAGGTLNGLTRYGNYLVLEDNGFNAYMHFERSTDGGVTWRECAKSPSWSGYLQYDYEDHILYDGCGNRSFDFENTTEPAVPDGSKPSAICGGEIYRLDRSSIVIHSRGNAAGPDTLHPGPTLYPLSSIAATVGGVWVASRVGGVTAYDRHERRWIPSNDGLRDTTISVLKIFNNTLYAGSLHSGIYRAALPTVPDTVVVSAIGTQAVCAGDTTWVRAFVRGTNPPFTVAWTKSDGSPIDSLDVMPGASATDSLLRLRPRQSLNLLVSATNATGRTDTVYMTLPVNEIPHPVITRNGNRLVWSVSDRSPYWSQWFDGRDSAIKGAYAHEFQPTKSDSYYVKVNIAGCMGISPKFYFQLDGVSSPALSPDQPVVSVWPNPASDIVTISIADLPLGEQTRCTVTDVLGRAVIVQMTNDHGTTTLDVGSLPPGLYTVSIGTRRTVYCSRLNMIR